MLMTLHSMCLLLSHVKNLDVVSKYSISEFLLFLP